MDRSLKAGQRSIIFKYSKQRRHLQKNITVISKRNPENQEEIQGKQLKLFTHTQTASSRSREKVFSFFLFSWRTTPARFCIFSPWSYKSFPSSKDYATRIECARNHHLCQRSSAKWTLNLEAIFSRIFCFCISINAFLICIIIMKKKKRNSPAAFFRNPNRGAEHDGAVGIDDGRGDGGGDAYGVILRRQQQWPKWSQRHCWPAKR